MNQITLIGNVGRDPELTYTPSGMAVAKFSLATSYRASKDKEQETTWHYIVAFGNQAETLNQYVSKGNKLFVQGRLSKRQYTNAAGEKKEAIEVIVSQFEFLSRKEEATSGTEEDESQVPF